MFGLKIFLEKIKYYFNSFNSLLTMNNNDSVIVLTDVDGEFIVKGKNHPDNIITVNLSDEESDAEEPVTSSGCSANNNQDNLVKLDKIVSKKNSRKLSIENFGRTEVVSLITKRGIIKEFIDINGLGKRIQ